MTAADQQPIRRVEFDPSAGVLAQPRLDSLAATMLCDTPRETSFDRLVELITHLLDVPVALVSLVDDRRQFFKADRGLPADVERARETPLSHSFCQYLVAADAPLVIDDARLDPRLASNGAVGDLGVVAYAGFPIRGPGGHAIGSLCAIDVEAKAWSADDLAVLDRLAEIVSELIAFRATATTADDRQATIAQLVESQEIERTRVAAELHDDTLQVLSALSIRLQLIGRTADPDIASQLEQLTTDVTDASRRIRRYVTDLRPDTLGDESLAVVLAEHLDWAVREQGGTSTSFTGGVTDEPDDAVKITLFRITQQAIANSLAHADPGHISVEARTAGHETEVVISDDGTGFDTRTSAPAGHHGLRIMRERAVLVGGRVTVDSAIGRGTTVRAVVPTHAAG